MDYLRVHIVCMPIPNAQVWLLIDIVVRWTQQSQQAIGDHTVHFSQVILIDKKQNPVWMDRLVSPLLELILSYRLNRHTNTDIGYSGSRPALANLSKQVHGHEGWLVVYLPEHIVCHHHEIPAPVSKSGY